MKKNRKNRALALLLTAALFALSACAPSGGGAEQTAQPEGNAPSAQEITGTWRDDQGGLFEIDADAGTYWYETACGRVGEGAISMLENGEPYLSYDSFVYTFTAGADGSLSLRQNGSSYKAQSIDGLTLQREAGAQIDRWELSALSGTWQNAAGETIVIDGEQREYEASRPDGTLRMGTVSDEQEGLGPYLVLDGHAFVVMGKDQNRFVLHFTATEWDAPQGNYLGVFYRDGDISAYSDPDSASCRMDETGAVWMFDGQEELCLGTEYGIDESGAVFYQETGAVLPGAAAGDSGDGDDSGSTDETEDFGDFSGESSQDVTIEWENGELRVFNHTANVQCLCPEGYAVTDAVLDSLTVTDNENGYAVCRDATMRYNNFEGTDEEFALEYANIFVFYDFQMVYGGSLPETQWDWVDESGVPGRITTLEGWAENEMVSVDVRLVVEWDETGSVMAKGFFAPQGQSQIEALEEAIHDVKWCE